MQGKDGQIKESAEGRLGVVLSTEEGVRAGEARLRGVERKKEEEEVTSGYLAEH